MTNLRPIEGGKKDPKTKLGTVGGLEDGLWALRFVSILVLGLVPMLIGFVLAMNYSYWWLALTIPFMVGLGGLIAVLVVLSFVDLWNEAWRTPRDG